MALSPLLWLGVITANTLATVDGRPPALATALALGMTALTFGGSESGKG